jgi:hypothetical protein
MIMIYTAFDIDLRQRLTMRYPNGVAQEFQFPPLVNTDMMSGEFTKSGPPAPGIYPIYVYGGPNERVIGLETSYVIEGGEWSLNKVRTEVQKYRAFFFELKAVAGNDKSIKSKIYDIGTGKEGTFFIRSLSINHGNSLIKSGGQVYPLKTDVKFELVYWLQNPTEGKGNAKDNIPLYPKEWY